MNKKGFIIHTFTTHYYGDQIKEDQMAGTCSTQEGEKMHRLNGVLVEDLEKKRAIWRLRRG
jgi:hypothetical protein